MRCTQMLKKIAVYSGSVFGKIRGVLTRFVGHAVVSARQLVSFIRRRLVDPVTYVVLAAIVAGGAAAATPVLLETKWESDLWWRLGGPTSIPEPLADLEISRAVA